ncbi:MAG: class I SAM-dependent methyltransferase, partial [Magnetococcus sp. DMHC-8]
QLATVLIHLAKAMGATGHAEIGRRLLQSAARIHVNNNAVYQALIEISFAGDDYLALLSRLHRWLQPSVYLEIGVFTGKSLTLAQPPTQAIGIDPRPSLSAWPPPHVQVLSMTSDQFFASGQSATLLQPPDRRLDLVFIDGLHRFEQVLRDFINVERHAHPQTIVVLHDSLPCEEFMAARHQHTAYWTGDVWKMVPCLRHYRPDLRLFTIPAAPSGLTLVTGLDGTSTVLDQQFAEAVTAFQPLDYQDYERLHSDGLFNMVANDWETVQERLVAIHGLLPIHPSPTLDFQIVILGYDMVFRELAETLLYGLQAIGLRATISTQEISPVARNILLGAHLFGKTVDRSRFARIPADTIIYNFEQMSPESGMIDQAYLDLLNQFEIWDYSLRNMERLRLAGVTSPLKHVPVGYVPELTRIPVAASEDIDVLFYGSANGRRQRVLDALRAAGVRVHHAIAVYGIQRDDLISRARIVLNMHYYQSSIFEQVRVFYLLVNRKAVVSECGPSTEMDDEWRHGMVLADYDELVDACLALLQDEPYRQEVARRGFECMTRRPEGEILRRSLQSTSPQTTQAKE